MKSDCEIWKSTESIITNSESITSFPMEGSVDLIERLTSVWEVSEGVQDGLLRYSRLVEEPREGKVGRASAVGMAFSVSTFVAQKGFDNFVVPPFGAHWGIVCDFELGVRYLFHLLFEPIKREVRFASTSWQPEWSKHKVTAVGTTRLGPVHVTATGDDPFSTLTNGVRRVKVIEGI
jgi:hypothetical protein